MELLKKFKNGDEIVRSDTVIAVCFQGKRHVLSTAPLNGGYHEDLRWIVNQDCKPHDGSGEKVLMKGKDYKSHVEVVCGEMGFLSEYASGMITAADMQNVSICTKSYQDVSVTAVITGGIDDNGGRVGDAAFYHERAGEFIPVAGTINIFLLIEADLTPGAMARTMITATEAKTSVIQELFAPSCYSSGLATGSGTDGIIVVSNAESDIHLSEAGKHSKLGELIGTAVRESVRESLYLQSGICPKRQFTIFRRMGRFGVTVQTVLEWIQNSNREDAADKELDITAMKEEDIYHAVQQLEKSKELIIYVTFYAHLLDQLQWKCIPVTEAKTVAQELLYKIIECTDLQSLILFQIKEMVASQFSFLSFIDSTPEELIQDLSEKFKTCLGMMIFKQK